MIPITQIAILKGGLDKPRETPAPTIPAPSNLMINKEKKSA